MGVPDDLLLIHILPRLPAKSLYRFKCVSKTWLDLIESDEFVKNHLKQSFLKNSKAVSCLTDGGKRLYAADFWSPENFQATVVELYCFQETAMQLVGSCNGLLCMNHHTDYVVLANPWTRKYRKLPKVGSSILETIGGLDGNGFRVISYAYGFGYDDVNDDYKVVRLLECETACGYTQLEAMIYCLKSDSWRRLSGCTKYSVQNNCKNCVLVNSAVHWLPRQWGDIVAIDLIIEQHRLLLEKPGYTFRGGKQLGVLNGYLCVISQYSSPLNPLAIDIWVMKEYGIEDSWTKLVVKRPEFYSRVCKYVQKGLNPLTYAECGNELILRHTDEEVIWYDIEEQRVQKSMLLAWPFYICHSCPIIQTLVEP